MREFWNFLTANEFSLWRDEINQENRLAIHMLATAGLPLSVANIFAQTFFSRRELFSMRTVWLLAYFLALFLFERFAMPKNCRRSTRLIYVLEAPPLVVSILLGTVWDPAHQALTFLLFLTVMPVFIFDRPLRLLSISVGWSVAFLSLSFAVKDFAVWRGDFFHVIEFQFASMAVTLVVLRVRLESLRNFKNTRYHLEHDTMTGLPNRHALSNRAESYWGKPAVIVFGTLDQLSLYNDFYGQKTGDKMLTLFTRKMRAAFGEAHTFRYGGNEILGIASGASEEDILSRIALCRGELRHRAFNNHTLSLTCSFGYVTGTPGGAKEFQEMIHLANLYLHNAVRQGQGKTVGGPFDVLNLRAAIAESKISAHAHRREADVLTELPSLSVFTSHPWSFPEGGSEAALHPVVGFFHIIRLRDFNDEFGYANGDALINHTAKLLRQAFRHRSICHITGSQFGILCYRDEVEPGLRIVNDGLAEYKPDFPIVTKTGFVEFRQGESMVSMLDKAKAAHDAIYDQPGVSCSFYDKKMDADNHFRQYIISHVDEAIEKGWLKVFYQPIVRTVTGEICNEEALSRWDDPVYGFLSPVQFVPTLEDAHLIYKVSLHVVQQILDDFRKKEAHGVKPVPVSVNLSRYDFEQCDMVQAVTDMMDKAGYSRDLIRIEITESAFMENEELLKREIDRFRENGFEVWMDDFGSEYSTLNMLQDLNFDLIKIDMEFMRNFSASGKNMIIVSNIIEMARRMGISTLVEGIETEEHFRLLRKLGCQKLQGYLFSRPRSLENVLEWTLSGEGIHYEDTAETSYYETVGGIDLNAAPESGRPGGEGFPSGILEYLGGRFVCIRGSDTFLRLLQEMELLPPSRMGTDRQTLIEPPPLGLIQAAGRSGITGEWVTVQGVEAWTRNVTVRLRRVSRNDANGCVAFLAVLIPHAV